MKIIEDESLREKVNVFRDRIDAGERLAEKLKEYAGREDVVILAIPSGGVPVGLTIASKLNCRFNLLPVRKLHLPWDPEAGFGAVSWDGTYILNEKLVKTLRFSKKDVEEIVKLELNELKRRLKYWGISDYKPYVKDMIAVIVDDGLASGYTMKAGIESLKKYGPKEIVVSVPTASVDSIKLLENRVDKIVCLNIRSSLIFAVADAYIEWRDISEREVKKLLEEYREHVRRTSISTG
ncbi:MAG: phosphoribosyltransferase family protein [Nitrososphaerota archaeon]